MNPLLSQMMMKMVRDGRARGSRGKEKDGYSPMEIAEGVREFKKLAIRGFKDMFLILLGVACATFGLEGFLIPNGFIDGGATGMALLIKEVTGIPLGGLLVAINLPFILLAFRVVHRNFAIKTALSITALAIAVSTVPIPVVTKDSLLVAIFGGFALGAGIGFCIRGGAVIDGTEVLAIFVSRKVGASIGDIIIGVNVVVFTVAGFVLSFEIAMYGLITYVVASKALDYIVEGIEEYTGVTIISPKSHEIRNMIVDELGHGVTIYKGRGGYGKRGGTRDVDILYTVVTRLELHRLRNEIKRLDPQAFLVMSRVMDTRGGRLKKRPLAH